MEFVHRLPRAVLTQALLLAAGAAVAPGAEPSQFRAVDIDTHVEIGYGVAVADVDGDHKPDILLADKKQIVWYRNPGWEKFVIAENLTPLDNVCLAAADIDGDGKAELAVGAQWNPSDTTNSGAVFYLIPPSDRTKKWQPVELPHEPTVHRMRFVREQTGRFTLVVVPLHGRENQNGAGAGVKILSYQPPPQAQGEWQTALIDDSLHLTHNFEPVHWAPNSTAELLVAAKEGVFHLVKEQDRWHSLQIVGPVPGQNGFAGAGEVRSGKLPGGKVFIATVEPMHGNQLVAYVPVGSKDSGAPWHRHVIDDSLHEAHALACGDLLGAGFDQVVVGWRAKDNQGRVGIRLFIPQDIEASNWRQVLLDDNGIACEDLCLADLDGDGRLDIVASGRATRNLRVYFNQGSK